MQPPAEPVRRRSNVWFALVGVGLLLAGVGGGYVLAKVLPATPSSPGAVSGLARPTVTPRELGWYRNTSISYLNFGTGSNITAPILAFFEASSPSTPVPGQKNIIDTLPGQPSYSDFWRVYMVLVPASYAANSVRSFSETVTAGYPIEATNVIVNCAVENPNATIQGSSATLVQGWYRDQTVFYFDEGTNTTGWGAVIKTAPIYSFEFAGGGPVPGQRNIVGVLPGNSAYSDLWRVVNVVVNASYVPNQIMSASVVLADAAAGRLTLQSTDVFVNCPIVG